MSKNIYTDDFRKYIVKLCDEAKEKGESVADILNEYNIASSLLSNWRKKYKDSDDEIKCPAEVMREFGVDPEAEENEPKNEGLEEIETFFVSSDCLNIPDQMHRESVIVALVTSGYTVHQTVEDGQYFVNYERREKQ